MFLAQASSLHSFITYKNCIVSILHHKWVMITTLHYSFFYSEIRPLRSFLLHFVPKGVSIKLMLCPTLSLNPPFQTSLFVFQQPHRKDVGAGAIFALNAREHNGRPLVSGGTSSCTSHPCTFSNRTPTHPRRT